MLRLTGILGNKSEQLHDALGLDAGCVTVRWDMKGRSKTPRTKRLTDEQGAYDHLLKLKDFPLRCDHGYGGGGPGLGQQAFVARPRGQFLAEGDA